VTLKVALLIPSLDVGGSERNIALLGDVLAEAGFAVEIWLTASDLRMLPAHVSVVPLAVAGSRLHALTILRRTRAIAANTRRFRPDCIISFLESSNIPALLAALRTRAPTVVSVRGNPQRFNFFYRMMALLLYRFARSVVLPSREVAAYLARHYRLANTVCIPNFLSAEPGAAAATPDARKQQGPLLAVGRLVPGKRFDDVIEAASKLRRRELVIIGDGPERAALERAAREHAIDVQFRGALPHAEVLRALQQASALISMSVSECWPNAIAEALATGTPVIARDCNFGPREMLTDGVDGFLVGGPADLDTRAEIGRALEDTSTYARLCTNALQRAHEWSRAALLPRWIEQITGAAP
jgi:glycosyltransferase involved in cell wall biosynthesis